MTINTAKAITKPLTDRYDDFASSSGVPCTIQPMMRSKDISFVYVFCATRQIGKNELLHEFKTRMVLQSLYINDYSRRLVYQWSFIASWHKSRVESQVTDWRHTSKSSPTPCALGRLRMVGPRFSKQPTYGVRAWLMATSTRSRLASRYVDQPNFVKDTRHRP